MSKHSRELRKIREEILEERGPLCEFCGINYWTDLHHAIMRRDVRFQNYLDVKVNFMGVCHVDCHMSRAVDAWEVKRLFVFIQQERGLASHEWLANLPLKIKPDYSRFIINTELLRSNIHLPIKQLLTLDLFPGG